MDSVSELLQEAKVDRQYCSVAVRNGCPPEWDVNITEIGSKFWFQDQDGSITGEQMVSKLTNIRSGGVDGITSNDGCVRIVLTLIKVSQGGKEQIFQAQEQCSEKECLMYIPYEIGPKFTVTRDGWQSIGDRIQLIKRFPSATPYNFTDQSVVSLLRKIN